jgi:hypothetical protein
MLNSQTRMMQMIPIRIARFRSKPAPDSDQVLSEKNSAWTRVPTTRPLIARTLDQANQ